MGKVMFRFRKPQKRDFRSASTYHKRGLVYEKRREWEKAIEAYSRAIELQHPNPHLIYFLRANAHLGNNNVDAAFADLAESIRLNPNDPMIFFGRGLLHHRLKNYGAAINDYTRAISLNPQKPEPYYRRARSYQSIGDLEKALADFTQSIALAPDQKTDIYAERGYLKHLLDDHEGGIEDCDKAIELNPDSPIAYFTRGDIRVFLDDPDQWNAVVEDLTKAIELNYPKLYAPYSLRASIRLNVERDLESALADYNEAIRLDPNVPLAHNDRGCIHMLKGDYEKALADFSAAISLDPAYSQIYTSRGEMYFLSGQLDEALADFQKAHSLKPENKFAIIGLAIVHFALQRRNDAKYFWTALLQLDGEYQNPDKIRTEFVCSDMFVETLRKVAVL